MYILGVKVDNLTRDEALAEVIELFKDGQHIITTPNPEIILEAQENKEFKNILNQASLALSDGFGLLLASRLIGQPIRERITGTDFMQDICALAEKMEKSVFLLGAEERVAARAAAELLKKYPALKIVGAEKGLTISNIQYPISNNSENKELVNHINAAKPDILFVAFGHRKQEKWIAQNLAQIPSVKIAMGVGGAFDFIAGVVPRAPLWLRKIGLEWLWRLIQQPWRIKRIYNAVVRFPLVVLREKMHQ